MSDAATLVEGSLDSLARVVVGIIQQLQFMDETAKSFGRKSALLNQNPFETNLREKQLNVAEQFATELKKSESEINELAKELQKSRTDLEAGFNQWHSLTEVEDGVELERVHNSLSLLEDSNDNLVGTIEELENIHDVTSKFRDFLLQYVGEIKNIDGPLSDTMNALNSLILELKQFDALSTIIVDRYVSR